LGVAVRGLSHPAANCVTLELATHSEQSFTHVLEALQMKQMSYAVLSKSMPIKRLKADNSHEFMVTYELRSHDNKSYTYDYLRSCKEMLGAQTCKLLQGQHGARMLEFRFPTEQAFCLVLQKSEYFAERLDAAMCELKTAEIDLDPDNTVRLGLSTGVLRLGAEAGAHRPPNGKRSRSIANPNKDWFPSQVNFSVNKHIEEPAQPRLRQCKTCVGECRRQGRLGLWQLLFQLTLPVAIVLYYAHCISYVYSRKSESRVLSLDWLPPHQEIFIN